MPGDAGVFKNMEVAAIQEWPQTDYVSAGSNRNEANYHSIRMTTTRTATWLHMATHCECFGARADAQELW